MNDAKKIERKITSPSGKEHVLTMSTREMKEGEWYTDLMIDYHHIVGSYGATEQESKDGLKAILAKRAEDSYRWQMALLRFVQEV